ncbi:MAG: gamma carbonic anhydrase family protein [Thermoplasmata archaeon]|nr:gamma carbonic anhydrase family protein [Thermoplasmata archaeon]
MTVIIDPPCLVSKNASIVGDVTISAECSIWPFASIRGDRGPITIGKGSSIQDCCAVHCDKGHKVAIGKNVTVGHGAIVHGAIIGDDVIVGMNSVLLDDAEIGSGSIIGAGAVVPSGMKVPECSLVLGVPAKIVRSGDESLREKARANAIAYHQLRDEYLSGKRSGL